MVTYSEFQQLISDPDLLAFTACISLLTFVAGILIAHLRSRLKTLEYSVLSERLAIAAEDPIFGSVRITWGNNNNVANLYLSTVTLTNPTHTDFESFTLKLFTSDTKLLTVHPYMEGHPYVIPYTDEFAQRLATKEGESPTEDQFQLNFHHREFFIKVLNRGERAVFKFLTTVPHSNDVQPFVRVDVLHPGIRLVPAPEGPLIWGVPRKHAALSGLLVCFAVVYFSVTWLSNSWAVAAVPLVCGLFAQAIGAFVYKSFQFIYRAFIAK